MFVFFISSPFFLCSLIMLCHFSNLIRVKTESRCRKLICRTFRNSWALLYYFSFSFFNPWRKTILLKSRFLVTQAYAPYPPKVPQATMPLLTNREDQRLCCCGDTSHFFLSSWWPRASNRRIAKEMDLFTLKPRFVPVFGWDERTLPCHAFDIVAKGSSVVPDLPIWVCVMCVCIQIPVGNYNGFVNFTQRKHIKTDTVSKATLSVSVIYFVSLSHHVSTQTQITRCVGHYIDLGWVGKWNTKCALSLLVHCSVWTVWGEKYQCFLYEVLLPWDFLLLMSAGLIH